MEVKNPICNIQCCVSLDVPSGATGCQSLEFVYVNSNSECEFLQVGDAHLWQIMTSIGPGLFVLAGCRYNQSSV